VYGEDEASSDAPWCVRAESSNQVLHSVLLSVGAQPDSLIPEDTFTFEDPPSSELTPLPLDAGLDDIGPLSPFMQLDIDQGMSAGSGSGGGGGPFHAASEADTKKGTTDSTRQVTTAGPASKYNSSDSAQHSGAGALDLTLNLGLADGMTDEQLAEYLSSTFS
jgi:hypothetical protein